MNRSEAQAWADGLLAEPVRRTRPGIRRAEDERPFSPFDIEDALRSRAIVAELMRTANAEPEPDAGWAAVRQRAADLQGEQGSAAVRHAVKVFLTHHPLGRTVRIPALESRAPQKVIPSGAAADRRARAGVRAADPEVALAWWREDPEANEHHDHWHAVYPTSGIPVPEDPDRSRLQDRQGELFVYMHQQMLARYDHERIAVGLGLVKPLEHYESPIEEGYDPRPGLAGFPEAWTRFGRAIPRRPGGSMPERIGATARSSLDRQRDALRAAVGSGRIKQSGGGEFEFGIDDLGHAMEPSRTGEQGPRLHDPAQYPNFHGRGHGFLARAGESSDGVMADTDTAIRDPVFYRWHRHIDDFAFAWQERQTPHPHEDWAAPVTIEHLVLGFEDELGAGGVPVGIDELETSMQRRVLRFEPHPPDVPEITVEYLDHRPFVYGAQVRNDSNAAQAITLRLFIVAEELADRRRFWIELDKWRHDLGPGETSLALRSAAESTVIRKPAVKPPDPLRHSPDTAAPGWDTESYCDCGWPYNLLLPRGTREGMPFRLLAVATDWEQDRVEQSACGSMSFCGAKDRYPDARPMGFPFDRPVVGGTAEIANWPNATAQTFTIRRLN